MATGNAQHGPPARRGHDDGWSKLASGEAVVGTGRISAARRITPVLPTLPFSTAELVTLDDALAQASRRAGLRFSIYLGDLGADTRARAEELHELLGDRADDAVLVAVSPAQQVVEVVTGRKAHHRLPDRGCKLAVEGMVAAFKQGDLAGGLATGLCTLADQTDP
ncbi:MAG: DUF5130 family protein [Pseudonocardiaceae bacterium]